eukprot:scaffold55254_cov43-Prasinocladus_malaysianus.AAC.1
MKPGLHSNPLNSNALGISLTALLMKGSTGLRRKRNDKKKHAHLAKEHGPIHLLPDHWVVHQVDLHQLGHASQAIDLGRITDSVEAQVKGLQAAQNIEVLQGPQAVLLQAELTEVGNGREGSRVDIFDPVAVQNQLL